jgi:hypothetical protein
MARKRLITLLMPLPTLYNPDAKGIRKPIERRKFVQTAREISKHFDAGADLQIFGETSLMVSGGIVAFSQRTSSPTSRLIFRTRRRHAHG